METTIDLFTKESFIKKRNNQKFANRKNQINYNNRLANEKRKIKAGLDKALDKNRNILKNLLGNEKEVIKSRDFLLGAGFNFSVQTNSKQINNGIYYCVYDYGYLKMENGMYKIIKHG